MSKYLIKTTEQYRCNSESEAKALIESAKKDSNYTLAKYSSEWKNTKLKGEIVDEWVRVVLVKAFTEEKEPDVTVVPDYIVDYGMFPSAVDTQEEESDE